ncbi:hypothetical protein EVA_07250 [gut metagenome]|uniref:Uncharacterized protein n=1 Tax=gut metagenome TaxID=749906 RepID=J9GBF4_9ZZZZ
MLDFVSSMKQLTSLSLLGVLVSTPSSVCFESGTF